MKKTNILDVLINLYADQMGVNITYQKEIQDVIQQEKKKT